MFQYLNLLGDGPCEFNLISRGIGQFLRYLLSHSDPLPLIEVRFSQYQWLSTWRGTRGLVHSQKRKVP